VVNGQSDHEDVVRTEENVAAKGTGSYVAIPALHQREYDEDVSYGGNFDYGQCGNRARQC